MLVTVPSLLSRTRSGVRASVTIAPRSAIRVSPRSIKRSRDVSGPLTLLSSPGSQGGDERSNGRSKEGVSAMPRTIKRTRLAWVVLVVALGVTSLPGLGVAHGRPVAASVASTGCQETASMPIPQPTQEQLEAAGLGGIPLAPDSARRDLVAAPFSNPPAVTNPLFPIAELDSALLNGRVDGLPFYTETAIDLYAQADDGSVWYLGEDVFDYDPAGRIVTTEGTWHAGTEGPVAMIMPSDPQIGDANRPENIPGFVFEEVAVTAVDQTFEGPSGPVSGGIVGTETHQDGALSDKLFAPGYGEFRSTDGPDVEAMALASPTDSLPGGVPAELTVISEGADRIFSSKLATSAQWHKAEMDALDIVDAWDTFGAGDVPPRLVKPTDRALQQLLDHIASRDRSRVRASSIEVSYASINLQLRYRPVTEVDTVRFELWTRRALVHAIDGSLGDVRSDLVTIERILDLTSE